MNSTHIQHMKGFTLIELMVVVGIIAITMGIGMPGFQSAITSNRLTASVNDMVVALQIGRSESIKQMKFAGIKFNNNNSWDAVVFGASPASDVVNQRYSAATNVTYTVTSPSATTFVKYRADGRMTLNVPIIVEFSMAGNTVDKRKLRVLPSGQVKVCTIPSSDTCPF